MGRRHPAAVKPLAHIHDDGQDLCDGRRAATREQRVSMARLTRANPLTDPGIKRVRAGKGFRYTRDSGRPVGERARRRIRDLVIPPAWTDVWIARSPHAHIQAVGTDGAGRRQYIYHPEWRRRQDQRKFDRALALAASLPTARSVVTRTLRSADMGKELVLATAFRLLDDVAPRIGSERYLARHGSRGLTTLRRRDVTVSGSVLTFAFPGKSGQHVRLEVDDADLAAVISRMNHSPGRSPLLWYPRGRRHIALKPVELNEYIHALTGDSFTAKDFRTLRGTIRAAEALAHVGPVESTSERRKAETLAALWAAESLGNTPAVARASYIDPRVFDAYGEGNIIDLSHTPESAIRLLLGHGTSESVDDTAVTRSPEPEAHR